MAELSPAMKEFAERAEMRGFILQHCAGCGAVQWPPRDACASCWSEKLEWRSAKGSATVIAATALHISHEDFFASRAPWRIGTLKFAEGPVAYAHLHKDIFEGDIALVLARLDIKNRPVLIAVPAQGGKLETDEKLVALTSHEKGD